MIRRWQGKARAATNVPDRASDPVRVEGLQLVRTVHGLPPLPEQDGREGGDADDRLHLLP